MVAERGGRAALVVASAPGFRTARGLGPGASAGSLRRARTATRVGRTRIARLRAVLFPVRGGAVRYVAVYDRTAYATPRRLAAALRLLR